MTTLFPCTLFKNMLLLTCVACAACEKRIREAPDEHECVNDASIVNDSVKSTREGIRSKKKRRLRGTIVDSGASVHCIRDKSLFTHIDYSRKVKLFVADNRSIVSEGVGQCVIKMQDEHGVLHDIVLHNCVYSPHFAANLISTRRLWRDNSMETRFGKRNYIKCVHSNHRFS